MTKPLPTLTDQEVRRAVPAEEETGFGALATTRGNLPLQAMEVQATIDGLLAQVNLCQTFVNTLDEPLEATYIFPLPDRAAVTRFRMEVAGRVIEGVLKERGAARRDYDQAIQAGQRAAITEEERPDVFTMRVGNLMPGEEATVHLSMVGPLPYSDGEVTFRFPLLVAPRYIPGTPLQGPSVGDGVMPDTDAVPDASRITPPVLLPGFPNPVRLSLTVEVHSGPLPLGEFRSSLHAVLEEQSGDVRRISLKAGERLNRDFILRFRLGEEAVTTLLSLKPDDGDPEEGTFLLTLVPPAGQAKTLRPRDVIFVLDRSGSMGGWKVVAARRAMARMVDTLGDKDRFTVFAFDDVMETPPDFAGASLVPASNRNRFRAVEFLANIDARGGTEMAQPLDRAVQELAGSDRERDRILVLVTDGQIGNEDQILRNLGKRVKGVRIFTLGIDQAVNAAFLKRLATLGGGSCELVESEDRLDDVMDRVHRCIDTPVLTGLHLESAGLQIETGSVVPGRLPDLFAGAPLCILGRYRGPAKGSVMLQAADAAGRLGSETVSATVSANPAISCLWARGYIRELEDRYLLGHPELEKRIVDTSLKFGVLCRFTAFVAVDKSEVINAGGQLHQITQPVEAPEGWAMFDRLGGPALPAAVFGLGGLADARVGGIRDMLTAAIPSAKGPTASGGPGVALNQFLRLARIRKPSQPVDLTAYRQRARELLEALKTSMGTDTSSCLKELGVLAVKVTRLLEDLKSIGAAGTDFQPLQELLDDLQKLLAKQHPDEMEVRRLWSKSEEVLQAFAAGSSPGAAPTAGPDAQRRENFWK